MRIALGADHAGYESKEMLKGRLAEWGHDVVDVGTDGTASVDYPDFAREVGTRVALGEADCGILVCGTGIGVSIAANKIRGVRAAVCSECYSAAVARRHNDANVLCMGSRVVGPELMTEVARSFLAESFEGGRHVRRVDKIRRLEDGGPNSGAGRRAGGGAR